MFWREQLEKYQVWLYLAAVAAGVGLGLRGRPEASDTLLFAPLALLLYATFAQIPLTHLPAALRDRRYFAASLTANFALVPAAVWLLARITPSAPPIRLGLYLVLLVPCTDWFIVFTHLGQGDAKLAVASTPAILLLQFLFLPVYLWLFLGRTFQEVIRVGPFLRVFVRLIVTPLIAAGLTQFWADRRRAGRRVIEGLAWLPTPCLAAVIFLIAWTQTESVANGWRGLEWAMAVFVLYMVVAAVIGGWTARRFRLSAAAGRTLIFSVGTRNSFVALPFALALPAGWQVTVILVVLQPLVELLGMLLYLRLVPCWK